jgi:hypothetical protein
VEGWETRQGRTDDGAVESEQRVVVARPVVAFSAAGAERLGSTYWREVEGVTRRLVRARERNGSIELLVAGKGPPLLRFGPPTMETTADLVACTYPIQGGLLARRPAGEIAFAQVGGARPMLRSTITGFYPRLAAREGKSDWTGGLYSLVQSRIHVAVSRRYFVRLIAEAGS